MINPEILSESVTLYEGDCLEVLHGLSDGEVDHTITDPPYGEKTHKGARTGRLDRSLVDFDCIDEKTFMQVCRESVRVSNRWVLMTCEWRHAAYCEINNQESFVRCGVWIKPDSAPQFTGDRPGTGWEAILILHRPGKKKWNGGGHHAVWKHPVERNNVHRTQKPLGLVRQWIREFTDAGDTILDPFAGSGTTGVAAILEGRKSILIEKDPKYCDIIRRRIAEAEATGPGSLFKYVSKSSLFESVSTE